MEWKELKPDFERIFQIMNINQYPLKFFFDDRWELIKKGEIPYLVKDFPYLKPLIEEYSFEAYYNDLLFYANEILLIEYGWLHISKSLDKSEGKEDELLDALKFFYECDLKKLQINIKKNLGRTIAVSIHNQILLQIIRKALLDYFIKTDKYIEQEYIKPEDIDDWGKYIDFVILEKGRHGKKKGRKKKYYFLGLYIDYLQKYLQEYTELKAEEGKLISNSQASFIYKYLNIFGLIQDELSCEEDNVRLIFSKYKREKSIPEDFNKAHKEYAEEVENIKAKIMKLNFRKNSP